MLLGANGAGKSSLAQGADGPRSRSPPAASRSTARTSRSRRSTAARRCAARLPARGPWRVPDHDRRGEHRRRACRAESDREDRVRRPPTRFPGARRAAPPGRRLDVRRRAADAVALARAGGRAQTAAARRAVARPRAADRQQLFAKVGGAARRRDVDPARRAVRARGAPGRRPRRRHRPRRDDALRPGRRAGGAGARRACQPVLRDRRGRQPVRATSPPTPTTDGSPP